MCKLYCEYFLEFLGQKKSCESWVLKNDLLFVYWIPYFKLLIFPSVFSLHRFFFSLSFKKVIVHRKFKGSVSYSDLSGDLMLSTFLLSGAEINCFEKVGVFTGEEQVINFMFITATLGTNIGILGHGEMRDPRIEVVRSGSYIHYTVLNFVRDKLPCTRKVKKTYFFSLLHFFFLLQDIQLGLLYS